MTVGTSRAARGAMRRGDQAAREAKGIAEEALKTAQKNSKNLGGVGTIKIREILYGNAIASDRTKSTGVVFDLSKYNIFYAQVGTSTKKFDGRTSGSLGGAAPGRRDWINLVGAKDGQRFSIILVGNINASSHQTAGPPNWRGAPNDVEADRIFLRFSNSTATFDSDGIPTSGSTSGDDSGNLYYKDMRLKYRESEDAESSGMGTYTQRTRPSHYKFRVLRDMDGSFFFYQDD